MVRRAVYKAVAAAMPRDLRPNERTFYSQALRDAALRNTEVSRGDWEVRQRQAACAGLIIDLGLEGEWMTRPAVTQLAEAAEQRGLDGLGERLRKILLLESLIAPADRLFGYLCSSNGKTMEQVVADLRQRWGTGPLPHLPADLWTSIGAEFEKEMHAAVSKLARQTFEAFLVGDWGRASHALLEWNALVMQGRRGFAWIGIVNDRLDVRYRSETGELPSREQLGQVWRNSYFLDSLTSVTRQLEAA